MNKTNTSYKVTYADSLEDLELDYKNYIIWKTSVASQHSVEKSAVSIEKKRMSVLDN